MPGTAMLATFSRDWVGGDIRGLQEVAERLRALDEYVTAAVQTIDSLVAELSRIESALESEAYLAAMDGVHIGEDGTVVGYAGPHGLRTAFEYRKLFQQAQGEAAQARASAAEQLRGLYQKRMAWAI